MRGQIDVHGAVGNNASPEGMKHLEQALEANRKVLTRLNHVCRIGVFDVSVFGCLAGCRAISCLPAPVGSRVLDCVGLRGRATAQGCAS